MTKTNDLSDASRVCDLDEVRRLLANGANVNSQSFFGAPAIVGASQAEYCKDPTKAFHIVEALIAAGADVNAKSANGDTALMEASSKGNLDVVKALIAAGADVNAQNVRFATPRFNPDAGPGPRHWSALLSAFDSGNVDIVKALLAGGADVNAKDNRGNSALISASYSGNVDLVKALLAAGADLNGRDKTPNCDIRGEITFRVIYDCDALSAASVKGNRDVVKILLASGVDATQRNNALVNAAHAALTYGTRSEIAKKIAVIEKILVATGAEMPTDSRDKAVIEDLLKFAEMQALPHEEKSPPPIPSEREDQSKVRTSSQNSGPRARREERRSH